MSRGGEKEGEGGIAFVFEVRRRYVYPVLIFLGRSLQQLAFTVSLVVCSDTAHCLNLPLRHSLQILQQSYAQVLPFLGCLTS